MIAPANAESEDATLAMSMVGRMRAFGCRRAGTLDLFFSMMVRGLGAPLAFISNILIAKLLGPAEFGKYIILLSVALVAGTLAAYGMGPVLTREISLTESKVQPVMIGSLGKWALQFASISSFVTILITLSWLVLGPGAPPSTWPERIGAVSIIPLSVLLTIVAGVLAGLSRVAQSQAVGTIWKNGSLLLGVTLLLAIGASHPFDVLLVQAASFGLAVLISVHWVSQASPRSIAFKEIWLVTPIDPERARILRRSARHFLTVSLAWLLLGRLDVVIVNALAGTIQAGFFGVAARLGQMAGMAGLIWIAWLQPRMSMLIKSGQNKTLGRIFKFGFWGSTGMTAVLIIIGWFGAPLVIGLMGTSYASSLMPFRWLLIGYLAWAANVPFYAYLSMVGQESLLSRILWMQVIITIIISIPLAREFGALGGAWAWTGGMTIGSLSIILVGARIYAQHNLSRK